MKELKIIIAENLMNLRKANKLTQLELAEKLNYSDKAISKWERGESLPDILMLKNLADMYSVNVDYLLTEHTLEEAKKVKKPIKLNNKLIITLLSCLAVFITATIIYTNFIIVKGVYYWLIWLWAVPVCAIILIVFSGIWGNKIMVLSSVSLLTWSSITCIYLQFLKFNLWPLFLVGIPVQLAIILAGNIKSRKKELNS